MQQYSEPVVDRSGNVRPGLPVLVLTSTGVPASIYSDNGATPAANPLRTDDNGTYAFYAADGQYDIYVNGAYAKRVTLFDPSGLYVNPKDAAYGAKGDGVADDTAAVTSAVAAALASGRTMWWDGAFLTTASIPNLHKVRHAGTGAIKRGSGVYRLNPADADTNTLYVSSTGSASNDGLSATQPMATLQQAFDALVNAGQVLDGVWTIQIDGGTRIEYATLDGVKTRKRLNILGAPAAGGVPTTVFDGTGMSATSLTGIKLTNGVYVYVKDIKFTNWNGGAGVGAGDASIGLDVRGYCNVWTDNVHADACGTGVYSTRSRIYQSGGIIANCDQGSAGFGNSTFTFGYNTATTYQSNATAIVARDASSGTVENGVFTGNAIGVKAMYGSNTRISNATFTGSATADVYLYSGGAVFFGTGNTYTAGKKIKAQFGALDLDNSGQLYWDGDLDKFNFGPLATPGAKFHFRNALTSSSINSNNQFVFEDNSPQMGLAGNSGSTSTFGLNCSIPGNTSLAAWQYVASDSTWRMRLNSADSFRWGATFFRPVSDNTVSLGASGFRWSQLWAGTATINTSDAREKQQVRPISDAERAAAVRCKGLLRAFKFNDAVEKKGDAARIHFGVIAQDVKAAFEAEGLDGTRYAVLCYDEWPEQPEVKDEDGNVIEAYRPAGNRWGVRYEELLAFMLAGAVL